MIYRSTGILRYNLHTHSDSINLRVLCDPEISRYYRALVPKWIPSNRQAYEPHISVVRKVIPPQMDHWQAHEGEEIEFHYNTMIRFSPTYVWLDVYSVRLEEIREELGLPVHDQYTLPPAGFRKCFHMTIGNRKGYPPLNLSPSALELIK